MANGSIAAAEPRDHVVNVYEDDSDLVADVCLFLTEGLCRGEAALIIATSERLAAFSASLAAAGVDVPRATSAGLLTTLVAEEALAKFMVDGVPDGPRFSNFIGGLIEGAGQGVRPVRAFGEMVALLWRDGNVGAAIEIESLWNQLAHWHSFSLYCAYPLDSLAATDDLHAISAVCDQHSLVLSPRTYATAVEVGSVNDEANSKVFLAVPLAVRGACEFVSGVLASWGVPDSVDAARLVVSEMATNSIMHVGCPFRVAVQRRDSVVRISVEDLSQVRPRLRTEDFEATMGRGLVLVSALCSAWGTDVGDNGKTVWVELPA